MIARLARGAGRQDHAASRPVRPGRRPRPAGGRPRPGARQGVGSRSGRSPDAVDEPAGPPHDQAARPGRRAARRRARAPPRRRPSSCATSARCRVTTGAARSPSGSASAAASNHVARAGRGRRFDVEPAPRRAARDRPRSSRDGARASVRARAVARVGVAGGGRGPDLEVEGEVGQVGMPPRPLARRPGRVMRAGPGAGVPAAPSGRVSMAVAAGACAIARWPATTTSTAAQHADRCRMTA